MALRQTLVHAVARLALVCVFAYQGLIPKLVAHHRDEIAMLRDAGLSEPTAYAALNVVGIVEIAFAAVLSIAWRRRWPLWLCLASMLAATIIVGICSPRMFAAAFNPGALNLAVAALACVDLLTVGGVPSATRCLRRPEVDRS